MAFHLMKQEKGLLCKHMHKLRNKRLPRIYARTLLKALLRCLRNFIDLPPKIFVTAKNDFSSPSSSASFSADF